MPMKNRSFVSGMAMGAALVGGTLLLTAAMRPTTFDTIDVKRINVRENDGTLRLVIASRDAFPGAFVNGKEIARPDRRAYAGMLMMNDEGTENGGFIWNGKRSEDGVSAGMSLTFDRYKNDQTLQLLQTDSGSRDTSALILSDRPATPFDWDGIAAAAKIADPAAQQRAYRAAGVGGATRLFVGRTREKASEILLKDDEGRARLKLSVSAEGRARIVFLDADGKEVRAIAPE